MKLAQESEIKLQVARAFPAEVYPPDVKKTEHPDILYGDIDENYGLAVEYKGNEIVSAGLIRIKNQKPILPAFYESNNLQDVVNEYMRVKKRKPDDDTSNSLRDEIMQRVKDTVSRIIEDIGSSEASEGSDAFSLPPPRENVVVNILFSYRPDSTWRVKIFSFDLPESDEFNIPHRYISPGDDKLEKVIVDSILNTYYPKDFTSSVW